MNGGFLLISFLVCISLVYRKTTNVCVLILYLVTLLNVFVSSRTFQLVSLGFFMYRII